MKRQKIKEVENMNANNFDSWLKDQNEEGWFIVQIFRWQTYITGDLDFVLLLEKEELE